MSDAKLGAGVLNGFQIGELIRGTTFDEVLTEADKRAWKSLKKVSTKFVGKKRSPNYEDMVYELMHNFQALGARMSAVMHFLNSHLDYFPEDCGNYSEELGERFHQDIGMMEERYQGRWDTNMFADHSWCQKKYPCSTT